MPQMPFFNKMEVVSAERLLEEDSMEIGIKHFEVVKWRLHADKQWSPNKIRV